MSDLPPKPRLLAFLQGILMLLALGGFLTVLSYAVRAFGEMASGNIAIYTQLFVFSLITVVLAVPAVVLINKRSPKGRAFGIAFYAFGALRSLVTLIWFARPSTPIPGTLFSKTTFTAIMAVWTGFFLIATFAFAMSPKVKNYFYPERVPSDLPPPPPEFAD